MIHLIGDYYMTADKQNGGCYTVPKLQSCAPGRLYGKGARYYTTLAQAVASTAEIALRDKIASGEVDTLKGAVEELARIKAEIQKSVEGA